VHTTGLAPTQTPLVQESTSVQAFPSLHAVPSVATGFEHAPLARSQVPTAWHWSEAVHVTGFEPVQVPALHVSVCVQASPSLQGVPSLTLEYWVVLALGWHVSHVFDPLAAPAATQTPPMKQ
jgi:hypothetical protein